MVKYEKGEAVMICWDANEDLEEISTNSSQRLLKSKWNPKGRYSEGSWGFDLEKMEISLKRLLTDLIAKLIYLLVNFTSKK